MEGRRGAGRVTWGVEACGVEGVVAREKITCYNGSERGTWMERKYRKKLGGETEREGEGEGEGEGGREGEILRRVIEKRIGWAIRLNDNIWKEKKRSSRK